MDQDESSQNPTAAGNSASERGSGNSPGDAVVWPKISVSISGEVAYVISEAARGLNIKPQLYARMMLTDGLKGNGLLPKWWKRGKMNFDG